MCSERKKLFSNTYIIMEQNNVLRKGTFSFKYFYIIRDVHLKYFREEILRLKPKFTKKL